MERHETVSNAERPQAEVGIEADPATKRALLERLTQELPEWFGQPEANQAYAHEAEALTGYSARINGEAVGLLLVKSHSSASSEIRWMGVSPSAQGSGIGSSLVEKACEDVRAHGGAFMFVATLDPSDPYEPYQRTRAFYEGLGFELALTGYAPSGTSDKLAIYVRTLR